MRIIAFIEEPKREVKGVVNDGKGKKGKGRGNKPRKGAGSQMKDIAPARTKKATVDHCSLCEKDLREKEALYSRNDRIIKDIHNPRNFVKLTKIESKALNSFPRGRLRLKIVILMDKTLLDRKFPKINRKFVF